MYNEFLVELDQKYRDKTNHNFFHYSFLGVACSVQNDIRGTFVNRNSEELTIDCAYHVKSTHIAGKPFMPNNGDEIMLITSRVKQDEITVAFKWDSIISPFATWYPDRDEISIGKEVYTRMSVDTCK